MTPNPGGLTVAELQDQYDPEGAVPDLSRIMAGYEQRSELTRQLEQARIDIPYGSHPFQRMDIFPPPQTGRSPILIYIHGGYWRGGSRLGRAFPAGVFNEAGATWIPIDYRILPEVQLEDIVTDVRSAVAWVYRNAGTFGGDPERIYVSGSSAGGHLTAMLMLDGWASELGLPGNVIKGGCAISGLFELEPLRHTTENVTLRLDEDRIAHNSPIRHVPATGCPLVVAWGERESGEFRRQSREFATAWRSAGFVTEELELVAHDHFTVIGELANPQGDLLKALFRLMNLGASC